MKKSNPYFPNLIMIGGSSKNSGKTTLIRKLIEHFADLKIIAVKAELYDDEGDFQRHYPEYKDKDFFAIRERKAVDKDSGRFLSSGADQAWFLAAHTTGEEKLLTHLQTICETGQAVILESNILRKFIQPKYYVMIVNPEKPIKDSAQQFMHLADPILRSENEKNGFPELLSWDNNEWKNLSND
jgi:hypothetical protein